jgi:hypothetical protein
MAKEPPDDILNQVLAKILDDLLRRGPGTRN